MRSMTGMYLRGKSSLVVLAFASLAIPSLGHAAENAQAAPAQNAGEEAADDAHADIIVTATKRSAGLQDVPVSILALDSSRLQSNGVVSTTQLPQIAPGISFTMSGETKLNSFAIRGVGTYALSAALEPAVGVAVDGVPLARVGGGLSDLVDIARVEVLRGPQGTIFGKNATAGVISIVTRRPELGRSGIEGNISYGSYNEFNVDSALNLAISDSAAIRMTAWRFGHDGFVLGTDGKYHNNKNSFGGRVGIAWKPTDDFRIDIIGEYAGRRQNGDIATSRAFSSNPPNGPLVAAYESSIGIVPSPTNLVGSFRSHPYSNGDSYYLTGLMDYELGGGYTLSSVTSYRDVHNEGDFDPFVTSSPLFHVDELYNDENYHQFTQELRITSPSDRDVEFVAGLFYYNFSVVDKQLQSFFGIPTPGVSRYSRFNTVTNTLKNYAAFGEATIHVTNGLRLIGGLRYSHDSVTGSFRREMGDAPDQLPIPPTVPLFAFKPKDIGYDFLSWRAGAQLDIAPDVMMYATASRGYKAPGFNLTQSLTPSTVVNDAGVRAEKAYSLELGIRSQFFDRRLTVNLTGFLTRFKDFQSSVGVSVSGPPVFVIQNANELRSSGVELEVNLHPVRGVSMGLSGAYIDAHYADFDQAPCYPGQPTLPAGSALQPGFCVGGVQTLDGWPVSNAPKWSFNTFARFDDDIARGWRAFAQLDYNYRSSVVFEANRNPLERQDGYGIFNASVGIGPSDRKWELSLYVRNIADTNYVERVRANGWNLYQYPAYLGRRQIGGKVGFKF